MLANLRTMLSGAAIAGTAVLLLGGCGAASRSGPGPVPTWSCTPDGSGEPCSEEKAAAQAAEAEAYAEAMHAYREFTKERNRIMAAGGLELPPTETMTRYAAGEYLAYFETVFVEMWDVGAVGQPGLEIQALQPVSMAGDSLTLRSCEDGSAHSFTVPSGEVIAVGSRGSLDLYLEKVDGRWVIVDWADSEVEICGVS